MKRTALLAAIATLLGTTPALPQVGASRFALATVSDQRGRPVIDIGADDFAVEESGTAREVLSVRPADYPIVVVIDTAAPEGELADLQRAATQFVARLGAERTVAVVVADPPRLLTRFDDARSVLTERIGTLQPAAAPADVPRALALAAQTAHAASPLFSAIVAICPTAVPQGESTLADALGAAVDNAVTVHVIERAGGAGRAGGADRESPLRLIAMQTHGEYARIYSAASYQAALNRLADRLTTEVMIEYLVPVGSKPADVKLGVRVPGARVRGLGVAPR